MAHLFAGAYQFIFSGIDEDHGFSYQDKEQESIYQMYKKIYNMISDNIISIEIVIQAECDEWNNPLPVQSMRQIFNVVPWERFEAHIWIIGKIVNIVKEERDMKGIAIGYTCKSSKEYK